MPKREKNSKLTELTNKEKATLQKYLGYEHIKINTLINLDPYMLKDLTKIGWDLDAKQINVEEVIENFVNIYSIIYKNGYSDNEEKLYRGTTNLEAKQINENGEINKIVSTTNSEEIAKTFCRLNQKAILEIITNELPKIYVEEEKDGRREENETIILPFSEVINIDEIKTKNGITYYKVELKKGNLEELEVAKKEELKKECINKFEENIKKLEEYNKIEDNINRLKYIYNKETSTPEDKRYIQKDIEKDKIKIDKLSKDIKIFQEKMNKLVRGLCKEKELEIEQAKMEEEQENDKVTTKMETNNIRELKQKVTLNSLDIETRLMENIERIEENAKKYQSIANNLNIEYIKNITVRLMGNFENVKKQIQKSLIQVENEEEPTQDSYKQLLEKNNKLNEAQKILEGIEDIVELHKRQSESEIKGSLNYKIQETITKVKLMKLQQEKQKITSKKNNIFKLLTGENKLDEETLKNIRTKELLAKEEIRNPENNMQVAMQNIYDCIYENGLEKDPPPELLKYIFLIRRNMENSKFRDENQYIQKAVIKSINAYPIPQDAVKPRIFKNKLIEAMQGNTGVIEEQIVKQKKQKRNFKNKNIGNDNNAITQLEGKIGAIYFTLKEEQENEVNKKKEEVR